MTTPFSTFYQSLDADAAKRGKQFEHFVRWFLKNDPEWATQVDQNHAKSRGQALHFAFTN